jgi:enamine deaminase RidA (YjgF/YER057c/UK114 family)
MLLAVVRERGGATGQILADAGIDREKVDGVIKEIRANRPSEHGATTPPPVSKTAHDEVINPPTLAKPVGFSHGILTTGGRTLYLAGQTALDAKGNLVAPGDVVGQYRQVLANLWAVVSAANGLMDDIVKMTIFVQDRDDYKAHLKELGDVHKEFFGSHYPATALLEVVRFYDDGVLVEIEGIAVIL